jgi:hypothetical protein
VSNRKIVLFDLDGTLADCSHRRHLLDGTNEGWRAFYAACEGDSTNAPVAVVFDALRAAFETIWIVSGRSDEVRDKTEAWLKNKDLVPDRLIMRQAKDHQPDHKLKRQWLHDGTIPKDMVMCVFDDRASVVAMWREEGLPCFQVAPGDF